MSIGDLLRGFGVKDNGETNGLLKEIGFDEAFDNILNSLTSRYSDILKGALLKMLDVAVSLNDDESKRLQCEAIKETFNLTDKQLNDYLLIVKIKKMYQSLQEDLEVILDMIKEDERLCEDSADVIKEIIARKNMISTLIEKYFGKVEKQTNKYSFSRSSVDDKQDYPAELSSNCNFLLYLSNVDELRENTISSKLGKGQEAMSNICKELRTLCQSNYELLRQSGKIHQINEKGKCMTGRVLTSDNVAFERIGKITVKVGYVRVPVYKDNVELLRTKYNNDNLRYLVIVISFGDFKNESINEKTLYERFHISADKNMKEMEDIIKIFKEPFTPETLEIACSIIERGVDITRHLNENPTVSLEEGSSLRK